MSEHWIRLRGGWRPDRGPAAGPPGWLTLPLAQPPWPDPPAALARHFQAPPIEPGREATWLRIERTPGLRVVRLNGRPLVADAAAAEAFEVALPPDLPGRNLLELVLAPDAPATSGDWGHVALVIRARGAGGGGGELGEPGEGPL